MIIYKKNQEGYLQYKEEVSYFYARLRRWCIPRHHCPLLQKHRWDLHSKNPQSLLCIRSILIPNRDTPFYQNKWIKSSENSVEVKRNT